MEKIVEKRSKLVFAFLLVTLSLFFTFRGDFTSDYSHYREHFNIFKSLYSSNFFEFFSHDFGQEIGYVFVNYIVLMFTDEYLFVLLAFSLIIVYGFLSFYYRFSKLFWLSVLIFLCVGPFYDSFNITRNIVAVAIVLTGSHYLFQGKFWIYFLFIVIASLFHKTAIIMALFFFVLRIRADFKNLLMLSVLYSVLAINLHFFVGLAIEYIYQGYSFEGYGLDGASFGKMYFPIFLMLIVIAYLSPYTKIFFYNRFHLKGSLYESILILASVNYVGIKLLSLEVQLVERFSYFLIPFVALFIPYFLLSIKSKNLRIISLYLVVIGFLLYHFFGFYGSPYDPYFFIG